MNYLKILIYLAYLLHLESFNQVCASSSDDSDQWMIDDSSTDIECECNPPSGVHGLNQFQEMPLAQGNATYTGPIPSPTSLSPRFERPNISDVDSHEPPQKKPKPNEDQETSVDGYESDTREDMLETSKTESEEHHSEDNAHNDPTPINFNNIAQTPFILEWLLNPITPIPGNAESWEIIFSPEYTPYLEAQLSHIADNGQTLAHMFAIHGYHLFTSPFFESHWQHNPYFWKLIQSIIQGNERHRIQDNEGQFPVELFIKAVGSDNTWTTIKSPLFFNLINLLKVWMFKNVDLNNFNKLFFLKNRSGYKKTYLRHLFIHHINNIIAIIHTIHLNKTDDFMIIFQKKLDFIRKIIKIFEKDLAIIPYIESHNEFIERQIDYNKVLKDIYCHPIYFISIFINYGIPILTDQETINTVLEKLWSLETIDIDREINETVIDRILYEAINSVNILIIKNLTRHAAISLCFNRTPSGEPMFFQNSYPCKIKNVMISFYHLVIQQQEKFSPKNPYHFYFNLTPKNKNDFRMIMTMLWILQPDFFPYTFPDEEPSQETVIDFT